MFIARQWSALKGICASASPFEPLRGYNKKSDGFSIGFFVYISWAMLVLWRP
jgi:hypothetical protein